MPSKAENSKFDELSFNIKYAEDDVKYGRLKQSRESNLKAKCIVSNCLN